MTRIVILTLFYDIIYLIWICIIDGNDDTAVIPAIFSVSINYSMYLMQHHNANGYQKFMNPIIPFAYIIINTQFGYPLFEWI